MASAMGVEQLHMPTPVSIRQIVMHLVVFDFQPTT